MQVIRFGERYKEFLEPVSLSRITSHQTSSTGLLRFVIEFRIIMLYDIVLFIFKQLYFLFVDRLYQMETNMNFNCVTCIHAYDFVLKLVGVNLIPFKS